MYYILMNRKNPVLCFDLNENSIGNIREIYNDQLIPISIMYEGNIDNKRFYEWLNKRLIPTTRDNYATFTKNLRRKKIMDAALESHCLSLSDQYWLCREDEELNWDEINFFNNEYSYHIGNITFDNPPLGDINYVSPDLTTNGWLRKAWRKKNNENYLIKAGSAPYYQEPVNEALASELLKRIGTIDYVPYELTCINGVICSVCKNFLNEHTEFVPAAAIYNYSKKNKDTTVYDHLLAQCEKFEIPNVKEFIDNMIAVDYLLANSDRHMGNFGFLRDLNTMRFIGPAPLFDNGTSLWNEDKTQTLQNTFDLAKPFEGTHEEQILIVKHLKLFDVKKLKGLSHIFYQLLDDIGTDEDRKNLLCEKLESKIESFNQIIRENNLTHKKNKEKEINIEI